MSRIEDSICEAIELIVNKTITEAGYDKTIQGTIKRCVDESIGKYLINYQDSLFYAYSTSIENQYSPGSMVYILVPQNDMTRDKTILGTVDKTDTSFLFQLDEDEAYDLIGTNAIKNVSNFSLSSYSFYNSPSEAPTNYIKILYDADETNNLLEIDDFAIGEYIKQSSSMLCGATFKTAFSKDQKKKGNYGIIFGLDFLDNATEEVVTRYYVIDVDNMTGNPYDLTFGKRQFKIFNIDGANFNKISSISLFVNNFPSQKSEQEILQENLLDITVSNIELFGAVAMTEQELNSCGISFSTPQGTFFPSNALDSAKLTITANVKIKGKKVDSAFQNIPFYWFREDLSVTSKSNFYHKYGGRGWKCLNEYNIIETNDSDNPTQVEWIPMTDTYTVSINDAIAKETKIKCVILYDGTLYSNDIIIKNLRDVPVLTIESSEGNIFYYDIGRPTLTCYVDGEEKLADGDGDNAVYYSYAWGVEDPYGNLTSLPRDPVENSNIYDNYVNTKDALEELQNEIVAGARFKNEAKEALQELQNTLDGYSHVQMVNANQLLNVRISDITNFSIYKCSVFKNDIYLGTASIKLVNSLSTEGSYGLFIEGGNQTFQYDEYGVSPTSESLDNPKSLTPLTFSLFDNLGNLLGTEVIRLGDIRWKVPTKNTMLLNVESNGTIKTVNEDDDFIYHVGATELNYKIREKYYPNYKNNNIELIINYKDISLIANTNFNFIKQGEDGTNGTKYSCRIVPNSNQEILPSYPTLTIYNTADEVSAGGYLNFKHSKDNPQNIYLNSGESAYAPFIVKLYKSGEEIFSGDSSGMANDTLDGGGGAVTLKWSILANKYNDEYEDFSYLTISENNGKIRYNKPNLEDWDVESVSANIIKCTVTYKKEDEEDVVLYTTMPIAIAHMYDSDYHMFLKDNTGFRTVTYSSNGDFPKYDNTLPFEVVITKKIEGIEEDVTDIEEGEHAISKIEWEVGGSVFDYLNRSKKKSEEEYFINSNNLLLQQNNSLARYQMLCRPSSTYDGLCVNNTLICKSYVRAEIEGGSFDLLVGILHIPIHFLLNKYGLADLNEWDGNSIQLKEEGGFVLAPKVGAGKKKDNTFTGVLMGEVQEPSRETSDVGLLGYNKGIRSFFLDSETGGAIFGSGKGRIVIDPNAEEAQALIYGGNFWNEYTEKGFPKNYRYRDNNFNSIGNGTGKGMIINLSTPEIYFGSGSFYVSSDGFLHARGGGEIASWTIGEHSLESKDHETGMNAVTSGSGAKFVDAPLPKQTEAKAIAFWSGGAKGTPKFYATHDGYLRITDATIGSSTINNIYIGKSSEEKSAIYTDKKNSLDADSSGFYIGIDGIALGQAYKIQDDKGNVIDTISKFKVTSDGKLFAKQGYLGSAAKGWTIGASSLYNGKTSMSNNNSGVYLGTDGIALGWDKDLEIPAFKVTSGGTLRATLGYIGGWKIAKDSLRTFNYNNFSELESEENKNLAFDKEKGFYLGKLGIRMGSDFKVDTNGQLTANSGKIGGWTIGKDESGNSCLHGKSLYLYASGKIKGTGWRIEAGGDAYFDDLRADHTSGSISKSVKIGVGGSTIENYIEGIAEKKANNAASKVDIGAGVAKYFSNTNHKITMKNVKGLENKLNSLQNSITALSKRIGSASNSKTRGPQEKDWND